ncbi:uncharacterized protein B0I36DRAFT_372 [Microdochium trichocladiopsis]|uniref:Uncharacterized protein n=1 Tax=Microdochium trichocladiopsis TaxID=1682393 RepID=A0A9P8YFU7_9PEZI|nr:uncharacterized protein B0I36DRAFT_372 [Microdochium trichocladiopsis]KAH7039604.1 hypothetical protein B0I36DRAFT_372 [Microdochium trichocladiopsis]
MDFAPYQSSPPEHNRPWSPEGSTGGATSPRASYDNGNRRPFSPNQYQYQAGGRAGNNGVSSPPPLQHPQPQRQWSSSAFAPGAGAAEAGVGLGSGGGGGDGGYTDHIAEFDTSLGIRLDYEACLAYLALPPIGAIILLILERKSDYVRFHAWQSSLLFTAVFVLHLIFSFSTFLGWVIFLADLGLMAFLTLKAYRDADTLDRYVYIGPCRLPGWRRVSVRNQD